MVEDGDDNTEGIPRRRTTQRKVNVSDLMTSDMIRRKTTKKEPKPKKSIESLPMVEEDAYLAPTVQSSERRVSYDVGNNNPEPGPYDNVAKVESEAAETANGYDQEQSGASDAVGYDEEGYQDEYAGYDPEGYDEDGYGDGYGEDDYGDNYYGDDGESMASLFEITISFKSHLFPGEGVEVDDPNTYAMWPHLAEDEAA